MIQGNLEVLVVDAQVAFEEDNDGSGKIDPFVVIQMGVNGEKKQTKTIDNGGKDPKWNEKLYFVRKPNENMNIYFYDENQKDKSKNNLLGEAVVDLNQELDKLIPGAEKPVVVQLKNSSTFKIGTLNLKLKRLEEVVADKEQLQKSGQIQNKSPISGQILTSQQEIQQKLQEVQKRLDNLSVNIKVDPTSTYVQENLNKALHEGLMKISKERPANPIKELGLFLVNYDQKKLNQ